MYDVIIEKDKESYKRCIAHNVAEMIINRFEVLGPKINETYDQIFNSAHDDFKLNKNEYDEIYNEVDSLLDAHNPKLIIATKRGEPIYLITVEVMNDLEEGD